MGTIKTEMKVYSVEYVCDECSTGFMKPTGVTLLSYPAQFPHICSCCEHEENFLVCYPTTVMEKCDE